MEIKSYNRVQSNIKNIDAIYSTNRSADSSITKISPIKSVTHGFNPANLYLLQLGKTVVDDEYNYSKEDISKMDFDEFEEYLYKLKNKIDKNIDVELSIKGLKEEQILLLQDIFSQNDDISSMINAVESSIKNEDTENLFYYKKATNGYEKSYQNMAEFSSDGLLL